MVKMVSWYAMRKASQKRRKRVRILYLKIILKKYVSYGTWDGTERDFNLYTRTREKDVDIQG